MLYARVVLTAKENETTSDSKVILYRGDHNVDIEFSLKSNDYVLSDSVYAQVILTRPYATSIFSDIFEIKNNTVTVRFTRDMIDEKTEMESYAIQIRLYDKDRVARATLPPCYDVIQIKDPIAVESYEAEVALVNSGRINYSLAGSNKKELGDIFIDGKYNKTFWFDGDIISDIRLNKVEDALYSISETNLEQDKLIESHTHDEYVTDGELEEKGYLTEHQDISHLATRTFVEEKISEIEPGGGMSNEEREQLEKNTSDISTILDIIDTPPTYTKPTLSIGFNTSTFEHNKTSTVTVTPTFKQNDGGSITNYTLSKGGTVIFTNSTATSYSDSVTIAHGGSVSYNATATYGDGVVKDTLLGIPYPNTSIKAGSVSASGTIRAYALSYYGAINTATITANDISSLSSRLSSSKTFTHTVNLSEQRIVYMYPTSFGTLTSIKDANNFDYINSYTRTTMSHNGVDYYVYILTDPVTIEGFKQIFN